MTARPPSPRASTFLSRHGLLLVLILLVVTRTAAVLALGDVFFYGEELEKGTAAKAMTGERLTELLRADPRLSRQKSRADSGTISTTGHD